MAAVLRKGKFRSQCRRKRPKQFMGWKEGQELPTASQEVPTASPTTASAKKLAIAASSPQAHDLHEIVHVPSTFEAGGSRETEIELKGYRLVNCQVLSTALSHLAKCCKFASSLKLTEDLSCRRGLVSRLSIQCSNIACGAKAHVCDPYSNAKHLNGRSVLGMRLSGRGKSTMDKFCAVMDMLPPVTAKSYTDHCTTIQCESEVFALASQKRASAYLHHKHGIHHSEVLDITVTCDGTWSKRGFTARYGVVVIASWDSGQVLDCEILTKYFSECVARDKMDKQSDEYNKWWEVHKSVYSINYTGSSPAMEATGALRIWQRSIETLQLRYTTVISDRDSKTNKHLNDNKPYGEVIIEKMNVLDMFRNNLAHSFEICKKDSKGKPIRFGGRGRLTDKVIDQLQVYYGGAIRGNQHDLDRMERSIWAIFYHSVSTNEHPQHQYCPEGKDSWCKYQQARAQSLTPPLHTPKIPADLAEHIKPVFSRLSSPQLLEKCLLGATQNQNESFNSTIWNRYPITEFASPGAVNIAVNLAVLTFNEGMIGLQPLLHSIGGDVSSRTIAFLRDQDAIRIQRAQEKEEDANKKEGESPENSKKAAQERLIEQGVSYSPGGF